MASAAGSAGHGADRGQTLRELLKPGKPDDPVGLTIQVARGLVAAHKRGILAVF